MRDEDMKYTPGSDQNTHMCIMKKGIKVGTST